AVGGIEHREPTPRITPLDPSQVRDALTRTCRFTRAVEKGGEVVDRHVHPPAWCVAAVHKRADWPGLRPLAGVTTIPVLRPDGTLLSAPGYDEASRLLYLPTGPQPDVPDAPTLADAVTAANLLLSLVADFPFEAPEHRAAWLAGLLTPLARHAFAGPAPLFLLDANVRGSGKSLLCEIIGLIDSGRAMPRMAAPKDEDETRKRITALAIEGSPFVLIDNVPGTLGGASLDAALTSTVWKDRLLGESRTVEVPLTAVWYATGNNVALLADTARRVIHVRLDSPHERPEERTDFRQPDIERHVRAERPRYLAAALTVLRGWYAAGRPEANVPAFGSFAGWSGVVRQCLVWLGLPDPALTRTELVERSDRTAGALAGVVAGLASFDPEGEGVTANELVRRLEAEPDRHEGLRSALLDLCDAAAGRLPSPRRIGNQLGHLRNRVVGGRCLDYRTSSGARRWFVRAAGRDARTADR
ncbi:MAG TPA: hypothetical protein VF170_17350, partial [Planctomycetaceae bacterium]